MPCDTIQTSSVELLHPNIKLLMDALTELDLKPTHQAESNRISFRGGTWQNGKLTVRSNVYSGASVDAQTIKQTYSKQIIGYAAKQFGWKLSDTKAGVRKGVAFTIKAKKN